MKKIAELLRDAYAGRFPTRQGYIEVPTALFVQEIDLEMPELPEVDFYQENETGQIQQIRRASEPFSPLALSAQETVLIPSEKASLLKQYAEEQILSGKRARKLPAEERVEALRQTAIVVVEDIFNHPSEENIKKGTRVVSNFVYLLMREPQSFPLLSRLSHHDPYTLQHSVGTAVNSIILARKIGMQDEEELQEVGIAGLLHDIGKIRVDRNIINKPGKLDEDEWEEMKRHSEFGFEILKDNPDISMRSKKAVLYHHEDKNGQGYPHQIPWNQVDIMAKIVAISDTYNALTTDRTYSKAREPFEALMLIKDKLMHKIDDQLLEAMIKVFGGSTEAEDKKSA